MSQIREYCPKCKRERQVSGLYVHEPAKRNGKAIMKLARLEGGFKCLECGYVQCPQNVVHNDTEVNYIIPMSENEGKVN